MSGMELQTYTVFKIRKFNEMIRLVVDSTHTHTHIYIMTRWTHQGIIRRPPRPVVQPRQSLTAHKCHIRGVEHSCKRLEINKQHHETDRQTNLKERADRIASLEEKVFMEQSEKLASW